MLKRHRSDYEPQCYFKARLRVARAVPAEGTVNLGVSYDTASNTLTELIGQGRATYCLMTECDATRIREAHSTTETAQQIKLPSSRYRGEIKLNAYIVATQENVMLTPNEWLEYAKATMQNGVAVPKGAILAYAAMNPLQTEKADSDESFIDITPTHSVDPGITGLDLSGERISILVHPDDKPNIDAIRQNDMEVRRLYPSMYQRAIEEGIRKHLAPEHDGKRWARNMRILLARNDLALDDPEAADERALEYAQKMLKHPLLMVIRPDDGETPEFTP